MTATCRQLIAAVLPFNKNAATPPTIIATANIQPPVGKSVKRTKHAITTSTAMTNKVVCAKHCSVAESL